MCKKEKEQGNLTTQDLYQSLKTLRAKKKPQLQWADFTSVRQYVVSDPPTLVYHSNKTLHTGIPSVVWEQQLKKTYIQRYDNLHMIHKIFPTYEHDYREDFDTEI